MKLYTRPTAIALGMFDGVHLGHQAVLETVEKLYRNQGRIPGVFTFRPEHSTKYKSTAGYIYSSDVKTDLLKKFGMQFLYLESFDKVRHMDGKTFAKKILQEKFYAKDVCCGKNFHFGENAACNVQDLEQFGKWFGFRVHVIETIQQNGQIVSSTEIRKLLLNGKIEEANGLLGEPYQIIQKVEYGAQLGRTIGFPTINQKFSEGQLVPKFGVYASEAELADGRKFPALTNIGLKPTVEYTGLPLAETHLKNFSENLYGKFVRIRLFRFIREEKKFSSVEELQKQMTKDLQS